jgi:hypothetical protein
MCVHYFLSFQFRRELDFIGREGSSGFGSTFIYDSPLFPEETKLIPSLNEGEKGSHLSKDFLIIEIESQARQIPVGATSPSHTPLSLSLSQTGRKSSE